MFLTKPISNLYSKLIEGKRNNFVAPLFGFTSIPKKFICDIRILADALNSAYHESAPNIYNELLGENFLWEFKKGVRKRATPPESEYNFFGPSSWREVLHLMNFISENIWVQIPLPEIITIPGIPFVRRFPSHFTVNGEQSFPEEAWFFVNGVMTEHYFAQMNGKYLASIFHRTIEVINNPTDTLPLDLIECALGKFWKIPTETVWYALRRIVPQLINPDRKKVIVIAHSQGSIIMSNVLRLLVSDYSGILSLILKTKKVPPQKNILPKLEIYTFACPADEMRLPPTNAPYLEHFANERDLVARLGIIAENGKKRGAIRIDGNLYRNNCAGHFLNAHYLPHLINSAYTRKNSNRQKIADARLYKYIGGGRP